MAPLRGIYISLKTGHINFLSKSITMSNPHLLRARTIFGIYMDFPHWLVFSYNIVDHERRAPLFVFYRIQLPNI